LLQCGLLQGSFVPRRELRELSDLTRFRAQLASEQTRLANRIHKVLEDANIKLGAVASDILAKSGRAMLRALIHGERDPNKLANLAEGRLRVKIPELKLALGGVGDTHFYWPHVNGCMRLAPRKRMTWIENERLGRIWNSALIPTPSSETRPDWEQIGNSIGNVNHMRPQCENTKVATCEPWIRRL
jgi:hypothetical protein